MIKYQGEEKIAVHPIFHNNMNQRRAVPRRCSRIERQIWRKFFHGIQRTYLNDITHGTKLHKINTYLFIEQTHVTNAMFNRLADCSTKSIVVLNDDMTTAG